MTTKIEDPSREAKRRRRRGKQRPFRRGIYLLPSFFTLGNILLGFYAVVLGLGGKFEAAAIAIFIAGVLDGLDGRIARLTHTESEFGREFDSLADVLTFGAAPAYLTHVWGLQPYGRAGWLVPLFFLICAALRLARYNVQSKTTKSRDFVGLPTPAAAGTIAAFLFFVPQSEEQPWLPAAMFATLIAVGSLMVSTFRYPGPKRIDLLRRQRYRVALVLAVAILILASDPPAFILSAAVVYTLYGPASWLLGRFRPRDEPAAEAETAKTP